MCCLSIFAECPNKPSRSLHFPAGLGGFSGDNKGKSRSLRAVAFSPGRDHKHFLPLVSLHGWKTKEVKKKSQEPELNDKPQNSLDRHIPKVDFNNSKISPEIRVADFVSIFDYSFRYAQIQYCGRIKNAKKYFALIS